MGTFFMMGLQYTRLIFVVTKKHTEIGCLRLQCSEQNGHYVVNNILKCIAVHENVFN